MDAQRTDALISHANLRGPLAALAIAIGALAPFAAHSAAQAPAPASGLSPDDQALVAQASAYLDGFNELKGRFTQTDSRGAVTSGELYLKRPGYARFAYDPPSSLLVVADGHNVSITDPRLKTNDRYPLSFTPLSLVLSKHIRLDKGVLVTRVTHLTDGFAITAQDGGHRAQGQVILTFHAKPLRLTAWDMTDAQGQTTRIRLSSLAPTSGLPQSLFTPPSYYDRAPVGPAAAN
jgi:outer membrane lipoprotein-sorting protein